MINKKTELGKVLIDLKLPGTLTKYALLLSKVENACPKRIKQQVKDAATHANKRAEEAVRLIEHFDKHSKDLVERIIKEAEEKARNGLNIDKARKEAEKAFEELKNMVESKTLENGRLADIKAKFLSLASKEAELCGAWIVVINEIKNRYIRANNEFDEIKTSYSELEKKFKDNGADLKKLLGELKDAKLPSPEDIKNKFNAIKAKWGVLQGLQEQQKSLPLALATKVKEVLLS